MSRFGGFFELFGSFAGYVRFWLLDDLADETCSAVRPYLPIEDFGRSALPTSVAEYETYAAGVRAFVTARNQRIVDLLGE